MTFLDYQFLVGEVAKSVYHHFFSSILGDSSHYLPPFCWGLMKCAPEFLGQRRRDPRHLAASNGNVRATETLLGHGAFPWLLDDSGKTPLRLGRRRPRDSDVAWAAG